MGPALEASGVTRRFGLRTVLEGVTLAARAGETHAVVGRSGSGKTTLVHVLAGLDRPDAGVVRVRGVELGSLTRDEASAFRLRNIGVVFQHFNLIPDLTVSENIVLPLRLAHAPRRQLEARGQELLQLFGLTEHAYSFPEVLSGGELQRIGIARGLAHRPSLMLADEPTANLDEEYARSVVAAFRMAARHGSAVVVASHDPVVYEALDHRHRLDGGQLRPG